jgi:hypothetical protein
MSAIEIRDNPVPAGDLRVSRRRAALELVVFFALTYGFTWTICCAYLFFPHFATGAFGTMKTGSPIYFVSVYAPSLSGILLTLCFGGLAALRQLGLSAVRIAGRWWWILLALVGYPLFWLIVTMVQAVLAGQSLLSLPYQDWYAALPIVVLSGFVFRDAGPLGEEFGWRGFALPRLLGMMDARLAALCLGAIWAIWHVPSFYLAGLSQSHIDFRSFFFVVIGFSVLMTILFIQTRGSILLAGIIQHMWFNGVAKAGIHWIGWLVVAVAAALVLFGGRIWRAPESR